MKKILFISILLVVALISIFLPRITLATLGTGFCSAVGGATATCISACQTLTIMGENSCATVQGCDCQWISEGDPGGGGWVVEIDGVCGSANKTYAYNATGYGADLYCYSGTPSDTPAFPVAGDSSNWVCLGQGVGVNSGTCTAYREPVIYPDTGTVSVTSKYSNGSDALASWQISGEASLTGTNLPGDSYSAQPPGNYSINVTSGPPGYTSSVNSGPLTLTADQTITFNIVWTAIVGPVGNIRVKSNVYTGWSISGAGNFRGDGGPADYLHYDKSTGDYSIAGDPIAGKTLTYPVGSGPKTLTDGGEITFELLYTTDGGTISTPTPPGTVTIIVEKLGSCKSTSTVLNSPGANSGSWSGDVGTVAYDSGTVVSLTASPASNCTFTGWGGACAGVPSSSNCVGPVSANVSVTATFTTTVYSCSGSDTQSCTSAANACDQTNTGTQSRTCDTSNGTWSDWGSCSASTPSNPAYYGQACTGATSPPNSCGDTTPGGAGTYGCAGNNSQSNCSGVTGSQPAERTNYGNSCTGPTSDENACGMTNPGNPGTYVCPASGPGVVCTGTKGSTPPVTDCPAPTATISAASSPINYGTATTLTWSSTNTTSGTCAIAGLVSGGASSGSVSTGDIINTTTYTVTCDGVYYSTATSSVTVTVYPLLTCSPVSQTVITGQTASFTTSGGNGNYSWTGGGTPASKMYTYETTFSTAYSTVGNKTVTVNSNDVNKTCLVTVEYPAPTCSLTSIVPDPYYGTTFTAASGDGVNYSWTVTGGGSPASQGSGSTYSPTFTTSGTKTATVTSAHGKTGTCLVTVPAKPLPCNSVGCSTPPTVTLPTTTGIAGQSGDYCGTPTLTVAWGYYDYGTPPSPQSAYQIQIAKSGDWSYRDTGKVSMAILQKMYTVSMAIGTVGSDILDFGGTYTARVRVWSSTGVASDWSTASNVFTTVAHPYPQVNLTSNKSKPAKNTVVTFSAVGSDIFSNPKNGTELLIFGDGLSSLMPFFTSTFLHTYTTEGPKNVVFTVTDNVGYACTLTKNQMITVQKEIPEWIEVAPR